MPRKDGLSKKLHWNMIFLVLSGDMFFFFEKINIAFQEVKLLAENLCKSWKIEYFLKVEGCLIQKREKISIRVW